MSTCAEAGDDALSGPPWPQVMLAAAQVGPFSRGAGMTVAVLSTGVDADQPQLRGRVRGGFDAVADRAGADSDCTGTGTQVAGVIAAQPRDDNPVGGLAPDVTILPVRVVPDQGANSPQPGTRAMARGIEHAAANGADVIVVAAVVYEDDPDVADAVADALDRGVVVVAAAGDLGDAEAGNPAPYPASYDGVLGVGAAGPDGTVWPDSQRGPYVDLVAPGVGVPTLQRDSGLVQVDGTAVAAGYVGATAALVRSERDIRPAEVTRVLVATASATAGGDAFGAGMVSPYAAVADQVVAAGGRPLPAVEAAPPVDTAAERRRRDLALIGGLVAAGVVLAVLVAAAAIRRTRRQRWRPATSAPIEVPDEPIEPGPPIMLLDEPAEKS